MTRILLALTGFLFCLPNASVAQELAKIRHDYFLNPTGKYSPSDPWTRSRIWRRHTGHFGKFSNCDCEEQKRYSPYICWKNADFPFVGEGLFFQWHRDVQRIRQRIADGSCHCGCQHGDHAVACDCNRCANREEKAVETTPPATPFESRFVNSNSRPKSSQSSRR